MKKKSITLFCFLCIIFFSIGHTYTLHNIELRESYAQYIKRARSTTPSYEDLKLSGDFYYYLQNEDSATYFYQKSVDKAIEIKDSAKISTSYLLLAKYYTTYGNSFKKAFKYIDTAENFNYKAPEVLYLYCYVKSIALMRIGIYDKALSIILSHKIKGNESSYPSEHVSLYYRVSSVIYDRINDEYNANKWYKKSFIYDSLQYAQKPSFVNCLNLSYSTFNFSIGYLNSNQAKASYYLNKSIVFSKKSRNKKIEEKALITLAKCLHEQADTLTSFKILDSLDYENMFIVNKFYWWKSKLNIGYHKSLNKKKLSQLLEEGMSAKCFDRVDHLTNMTFDLFKKNDSTFAMNLLRMNKTASDSLAVSDIRQNALRIEMLKNIEESEEKQAFLLHQMEKEKKQKYNWLLIFFLSLIIVAFILFTLRNKLKQSNKTLHKEQSTTIRLKKDNELLKETVRVTALTQEEIEYRIENLKANLKQHADWAKFLVEFESLFPNLLKKITQKSSVKLTTNELRLLCLIKLNLTNKEAAEYLFISYEGAKKARLRLAKKFNLKTGKELAQFIQNV